MRAVPADEPELPRRGSTSAPFDGFWIHATSVATRSRGMGVAGALLQRAIAAARHAGADEVRLTVAADNTPSPALYRKRGCVPGGSPALCERLGAEARSGGRRRVPLRLMPDGPDSASAALVAPVGAVASGRVSAADDVS